MEIRKKAFRNMEIKIESAEQLFLNKECLVPLGIQVSPAADEPRFGVLGMDLLGNQLFICFTVRGEKSELSRSVP